MKCKPKFPLFWASTKVYDTDGLLICTVKHYSKGWFVGNPYGFIGHKDYLRRKDIVAAIANELQRSKDE